jgi:hypothetical protein
MAVVKFTARQRDHLVPTLVCVIQFMLGTTCLTINVSNFLATLFQQLFMLALVSLTICVMRFLLPIGMQKHPNVSTCNIFQSNLHIITHSSQSSPSIGIRSNLRIAARSSLSCPPDGIRRNLRIAAHNFLSHPLAGIRRMLLLRSNSVPLSGKMVSADTRVLVRVKTFPIFHFTIYT